MRRVLLLVSLFVICSAPAHAFAGGSIVKVATAPVRVGWKLTKATAKKTWQGTKYVAHKADVGIRKLNDKLTPYSTLIGIAGSFAQIGNTVLSGVLF